MTKQCVDACPSGSESTGYNACDSHCAISFLSECLECDENYGIFINSSNEEMCSTEQGCIDAGATWTDKKECIIQENSPKILVRSKNFIKANDYNSVYSPNNFDSVSCPL